MAMIGTIDEPIQLKILLAINDFPGNPDVAISTLNQELIDNNQTESLSALLTRLNDGDDNAFDEKLKSILLSRCCVIPPALAKFWTSVADSEGVDRADVDLHIPRPLRACEDSRAVCLGGDTIVRPTPTIVP